MAHDVVYEADGEEKICKNCSDECAFVIANGLCEKCLVEGMDECPESDDSFHHLDGDYIDGYHCYECGEEFKVLQPHPRHRVCCTVSGLRRLGVKEEK